MTTRIPPRAQPPTDFPWVGSTAGENASGHNAVEEDVMSDRKPVLRGLVWVLCNAAMLSGCIITGGGQNDEGGDGSGDSSQSTTNPFTTGDTSGQADSGETGNDDNGTTTDTPMGDCGSNLVVDGGFEAGTPSEVWDESSEMFGTPICDASCTEDIGAEPYAGDWFAWFGGVDGGEPETASVSQTITIDPDAAYLSFRFAINDAAGTGNDVFTAELDGEVVFLVTDVDMADFDGYTAVTLDVSTYADGQPHELRFAAELTGEALTNFFLDEVELVSCDTGTGGSSSGSDGGSSSGTTAADGSTSGTDTGGSSGSSGTGGSSGGTDTGAGSSSGGTA